MDLLIFLREEAEIAENDGCPEEAMNLRAAANELERLRRHCYDLKQELKKKYADEPSDWQGRP